MISRPFVVAVAMALLASLPLWAQAGSARVAVAANFTAPMKVIAQHFERDTGYKAVLSFGATGQLYAQIKNGAPFDILLSADAKTPEKLASEGQGVRQSQFTYALGKLVLWSKTPNFVTNGEAILRSGQFDRIAIANPKLAPYGAAAMETIRHFGLNDSIKDKTVLGTNIGQTYQFVASGNAILGFIALSQVYESGRIKEGSGWIVPSGLYSPIKQDAILLAHGANNPAAKALLQYLRSDTAKTIIRSFGYDL